MNSPYTSWVQRGLRKCGLTLIKNDHPGVRYVEQLPVSALTYALHRAFSTFEGIRFLQIGAHDGIRNDPLNPLLRRWNWPGVRVEPHPAYFAALQRQTLPGVEVLQAAVTPEDGSFELYFIDPAQLGLPDWSAGLATLDHEKIIQSCSFLNLPESAIRKTTVEGLSWKTLLDRLKHPKIDLLCLDVEGMDVPLLRQWDFNRHRPPTVFFEHGRAETNEKWQLYQSLAEFGYEITTEGADTAAFLPKEKNK